MRSGKAVNCIVGFSGVGTIRKLGARHQFQGPFWMMKGHPKKGKHVPNVPVQVFWGRSTKAGVGKESKGKTFIGRVRKHDLLHSDTSFLRYYFSLVELQTMQYFYLKVLK